MKLTEIMDRVPAAYVPAVAALAGVTTEQLMAAMHSGQANVERERDAASDALFAVLELLGWEHEEFNVASAADIAEELLEQRYVQRVHSWANSKVRVEFDRDANPYEVVHQIAENLVGSRDDEMTILAGDLVHEAWACRFDGDLHKDHSVALNKIAHVIQRVDGPLPDRPFPADLPESLVVDRVRHLIEGLEAAANALGKTGKPALRVVTCVAIYGGDTIPALRFAAGVEDELVRAGVPMVFVESAPSREKARALAQARLARAGGGALLCVEGAYMVSEDAGPISIFDWLAGIEVGSEVAR